MENTPDLWNTLLPTKTGAQHKYDHGHAIIYAAPELTGATTLASSACARMGTGLTSVLTSPDRADLYRSILPAHIMVRGDLTYTDPRITARLYGCGGVPCAPDYFGDIPTVLDADALRDLPDTLSPDTLLTPHEGEFAAAFPDLNGTREERIKAAAKERNCHIILKGERTLIAAPDGQIVTNTHATPWLATAGSGDVLAGMITGLIAQHMPIFDAACAAVWLHGECGMRAGAYLTASDLLPQIAPSLTALK